MQGNFFFLAPMRFQRSPCPFHSIRVTPRHAVNESAHHETTGDKIYQKLLLLFVDYHNVPKTLSLQRIVTTPRVGVNF